MWKENNLVVELYPGTIWCFLYIYLFMSGSPSSSIFVCHVSSAGRRGGRLLPHAWVWEEDSTPLHSLRHTRMAQFGLWLCENTHATARICPRALAERSVPSALCVCVCVLTVCWYDTVPVCLCTCVFLLQLGGMSEASVFASVPVCGMAAACVIRTKQESMTENPSIPGL